MNWISIVGFAVIGQCALMAFKYLLGKKSQQQVLLIALFATIALYLLHEVLVQSRLILQYTLLTSWGPLFPLLIAPILFLYVSPQGDLIYISSDRDKSERYGGSEIYTLSSSGKYTRLTFSADTSSFNIYPRISADGEQFLYCANCIGKDVNSEIYLISVDGENPINLTNHTASDRYGSWSPDGKQVLFESNRSGNFELYVLSLETKELRQLTFNESADIQGDWSSNNEIVFSSNRDGDYEIHVMKSDGTNVRQLTFNKAKDCWPSWSPDGTHIAFSAYRRGKKDKADVYLIQSNGDSEKLLSL